jgi:hypothetical protein
MTTSAGKRIVLDTNVLAVAEGMHEGASDLSRAACLAIVRQVKEGLVLTVDQDDEIVTEYMKVLSNALTDGLGKLVARKIHRLRKGGEVCHMVPLTPTDPPPASFEEVPAALRDFDEDDHMFIGVAAVDGAPIVLGLDGEWWARQSDFVASGINLRFLCIAQLMENEASDSA